MDFYWSNISCSFFFTWLFPFFFILFNLFFYFSVKMSGILKISFYLKGWLSVLKRFSFYFVFIASSFSLVLVSKFLGLFPYIFSSTSHIFFNLVFAFVFWFLIVFFTFSLDPVYFFAHQSPLGSPIVLIPLLNMVELVSNFIRPLTLSLRLSVKMSTGHIFIFLLSKSCLKKGIYMFFGNFLLALYFVFEIGIATIQSFVFNLLLVQYSNEV